MASVRVEWVSKVAWHVSLSVSCLALPCLAWAVLPCAQCGVWAMSCVYRESSWACHSCPLRRALNLIYADPLKLPTTNPLLPFHLSVVTAFDFAFTLRWCHKAWHFIYTIWIVKWRWTRRKKNASPLLTKLPYPGIAFMIEMYTLYEEDKITACSRAW